jgi:hypothetical protein
MNPAFSDFLLLPRLPSRWPATGDDRGGARQPSAMRRPAAAQEVRRALESHREHTRRGWGRGYADRRRKVRQGGGLSGAEACRSAMVERRYRGGTLAGSRRRARPHHNDSAWEAR